MRFLLSCSILAMTPALLLSGCGEDGTFGPSGPGGTPSLPTPTPTPTPASQTPDFSQSWSTQTQAVLLERHYRMSGSDIVYDYGVSTLFRDLDAIDINYVASNRRVDIRTGGRTFSFNAADINFDGATGRTYQWSDGSFVSLLQADADLDYVNWGSLSEPLPYGGSTMRYFLFGANTASTSVPTLGQVNYQAKLSTTSPETDGGSGLEADIPIQIDFATGLLEGSFTAVQSAAGSSGPAISMPMLLSGRYSSDGTFSGDVLSPCRCAVYGEFTGRLYGPGADEVGLLLRLTLPDVPIVDVVGTVIGRKD